MSINMLNKESALFRSISSVSLSLFPHCYSLTHWTFTCLTALSTNFYLECVRLTEQYYFIFPRLSKVRSILHHGLVGPVQNKNTNLCFHILFCHLFHHKICVFIIFISFFFFFFDEVSNFRNRILTNQKQEFAVQSCQWNCLPQYFLNWNITLRLLHRFDFTL